MSQNTSAKSTSSNAGPTPWSLGGEPPEPQNVDEVKTLDDDTKKEIRPGDTHTGTDPLGRAIGPREDHTKVKKVRNDDGEIVNPYTIETGDDGKPKRKTIDTRAPQARVKKIAEATGTTAEAVDEPKPYTPSEVAEAHAADAVLAPKED